MLAVVFALQKWHQFAFGRHVIVRTDHKLREAVKRKRLKYYRTPRCLEGMQLRSLTYDIEVQAFQ